MKLFEFKDYLLNENLHYLGQRIGDILNAMQDLQQNGKNMGTRQLAMHSEVITNQIRKILHSKNENSLKKFLKPLQKIGVALMQGIDEKSDLLDIITSATEELQKLSEKMGNPINKLAEVPEDEKEEIEKPQPPADSNKPAPNAQLQNSEIQPPMQGQNNVMGGIK